MEIGSFIEMSIPQTGEYYRGNNVAALNCGRASIYHAMRVLGCKTVYLPYYQCETVREFLLKKGIEVRYYEINTDFEPKIQSNPHDTSIVIVNYYGVISHDRIVNMANRFNNVIVDNSQAFFAEPLCGCMNVYSARKFIGCPDGAYVVGEDAQKYVNEYDYDFSSDTCSFLLQRIEYGCEGKTYQSRMLNENRIDNADTLRMSKLTKYILCGADYSKIIEKRKENYKIACSLFDGINKLSPSKLSDDSCVPMAYPLLVESDNLLQHLLQNKIFQGHWWSYVCKEVAPDSFEYYVSRYIIPITIDQRYGIDELEYTRNLIIDFLESENK